MLTYRGVVYPWHCDHMGHMNVMWYTGKFDEATWNLFATYGITAEFMRTQQKGLAAVQQNTAYKKELMAGDVIRVESEILELREKVVIFRHQMFRGEDDEPAAIMELTGVCLDYDTRRSCPMPADAAARIREKLSPQQVL